MICHHVHNIVVEKEKKCKQTQSASNGGMQIGIFKVELLLIENFFFHLRYRTFVITFIGEQHIKKKFIWQNLFNNVILC